MFRALSLSLAAVATLGVLAACSADPTPTPSPSPTPTVEPTSTPTATPSGPAATATATPIVIDVPNGQAVTLAPTQDAAIWEGFNTTANGSGPNLFAGNNNRGRARRALLQFDIAGEIPAGATIHSVTLVVNTNKVPMTATIEPFALHPLLASWGEGSSNSGDSGAGIEAREDDVTWTWRKYNYLAWGVEHPGGHFPERASAKTITDTWPSTDALVLDVQTWLDDPSANHGWIIIGDENAPQTVRRFDSREGATPPALTIIYVPSS
ncbi:MAG: DNRLRE domain-containing protein [Chloroflexi bacterium]|nr:DNRLRE domain-containing protein [Chloroflexota bacterium]MDA1173759.1 DNRLRE domain-containing protein [Chloroflexota bacterium]